jgi:hypothetical protein
MEKHEMGEMGGEENDIQYISLEACKKVTTWNYWE